LLPPGSAAAPRRRRFRPVLAGRALAPDSPGVLSDLFSRGAITKLFKRKDTLQRSKNMLHCAESGEGMFSCASGSCSVHRKQMLAEELAQFQA
jgi:hypothetical protein